MGSDEKSDSKTTEKDKEEEETVGEKTCGVLRDLQECCSSGLLTISNQLSIRN